MKRRRRPPTLIALLAGLAACEPPRAQAPSPPLQRGLRQLPLGLCEDYPEESRSLAEARRDFELLRAAGLDVLRVSIGWDGVEPEKDRYDFAFWDAFVEMAVSEFGLTLIPYVAYTPQWNSDGAPEVFWKTPPLDIGEFAEIVRLLAERYRGRVKSWELWNEPDNRDYWLGTAADYTALLRAGAEAVRAADPDAKVVYGGLAGGVEFLRESFDVHRAGDHVDVVNLHAYYETWNPNPIETLPEYVDEVRGIVQSHGGGQPLWLAEVGYSNFRAPSAPSAPAFSYEHGLDFQAVALVRILALALAHPALSLVAWYELKDARASDAVIGDDHNRHLGVAFADYRPKPSLAALSLMGRFFAAAFRSIDEGLDVAADSKDVELRGFVTARGTCVLIAWLRTHSAEREKGGGDDTRSARVRVRVPHAARGGAEVYDERGPRRDEAVVSRAGSQATEIELDLRGGEVRVVEFPVAPE